jgi:AbrB family looped-hinge helix DNA binding protein
MKESDLTSITDRFTFRPAMTAITVSSKYQIVIPKEARERLQIIPGTRLLVTQDEHGVHLVKEPSLEEVRGMLEGMTWAESEVRDESDRQLS